MAITKIKTTTREEWLAERKKSLGGSDIGAVLGMNAYSSPITVWMDKTGKSPEREQTEWMRLGTDLEDYVAQRFSEKSGLKVVKDSFTWRNDKYPHLHANIDRKVVGQKSGLECKITSSLNEKKYRDGRFIDSYYAQCVEYLAVSEYTRWYLAVLIYGVGLRIYQMTRIPDDIVPEWCESSVYVEDGEINALAGEAERFWHYVETDTLPPADGHPATSDALSTLYPTSNDDTVNLCAYEADLALYEELQKQEDEIGRQIDEIANRIKLFMGESGKGESRKHRVTWTTRSRTTFDSKRFIAEHPDLDLDEYYKTTTYRTFGIGGKSN